jgi:hypothetical protein
MMQSVRSQELLYGVKKRWFSDTSAASRFLAKKSQYTGYNTGVKNQSCNLIQLHEYTAHICSESKHELMFASCGQSL